MSHKCWFCQSQSDSMVKVHLGGKWRNACPTCTDKFSKGKLEAKRGSQVDSHRESIIQALVNAREALELGAGVLAMAETDLGTVVRYVLQFKDHVEQASRATTVGVGHDHHLNAALVNLAQAQDGVIKRIAATDEANGELRAQVMILVAAYNDIIAHYQAM